jgi:hypothetical protein
MLTISFDFLYVPSFILEHSAEFFYKTKKQLNAVACSPQANYTDQAAAAC